MDHDGGVGGSNSVHETQPDVSQAEKLARRNVDDTAGDQGTQMGQRPSEAEAQTRAYFLMIAETSLA